ncbi:MAG: IS256 family transposase [Nitrospiraceae bacterium]
MKHHTLIELKKPEEHGNDPLTEVLRQGARTLLAQAIEAEVEGFLAEYATDRDAQGHRQVVRNGHLPEREIQTGIGAVPVRMPRVRDRSGASRRFTSKILPPYLRRTKSLAELIPWLYLKGVSTGAFSEALQALVGPEAPGLSPATVSRLKEQWKTDWEQWQQRDLSGKPYVYIWVDGIHCEARLEESKQCLLVIMGADETGRKALLGIWDGYRESEQSWAELLLDLKRRGLRLAPKLAIGDGALGFWKALRQVFGTTRRQRCWVHKTANVLNKLPKSVQKQAKQRLHEIWMAPTKADAEQAFAYFIAAYEAKYPKAVECLTKDRETLLAFYDFPAEHWVHLRTTNPIESTFATVRLRTAKTRGCLSRETALTMVFKLCLSAEKRWRCLNGPKQLAELIKGIEFQDGMQVEKKAA